MTKKIGVGFGVLILNGNALLLGRRHDDHEKADSQLNGAGTWTMPGGKLDFGETFEDGAYREVLEETGIEIDRSAIKIVSLSNDMVETAHFVTIGLHCASFAGEPRVMEPDEITEWQWFDMGDLPSPLYFPSKRILDNYHNNRIYTSVTDDEV